MCCLSSRSSQLSRSANTGFTKSSYRSARKQGYVPSDLGIATVCHRRSCNKCITLESSKSRRQCGCSSNSQGHNNDHPAQTRHDDRLERKSEKRRHQKNASLRCATRSDRANLERNIHKVNKAPLTSNINTTLTFDFKLAGGRRRWGRLCGRSAARRARAAAALPSILRPLTEALRRGVGSRLLRHVASRRIQPMSPESYALFLCVVSHEPVAAVASPGWFCLVLE